MKDGSSSLLGPHAYVDNGASPVIHAHKPSGGEYKGCICGGCMLRIRDIVAIVGILGILAYVFWIPLILSFFGWRTFLGV